MIIESEEAEKEALLSVAKMMLIAARTAPKARGMDSIKTAILIGDEKEKLADTMEEMGNKRDAKNVREAGAMVLIGVIYNGDEGINRLKLIDLGIALGSAVKIASILNVDNRIMGGAGRAAKKLEIIKADEIQGIPLSVKGKNIFFDRMN